MKPVEQEVLIGGGGESESSVHRCLNATVRMRYRPGHEGMQTTAYSIHSLERPVFIFIMYFWIGKTHTSNKEITYLQSR